MANITSDQQDIFSAEEFKKMVRKKSKKSEENIQLAVCKHIKDNYPDVIFTCDLASGMKLPIWLAARNKKMRSSRGLPDLFIAFPKAEYVYAKLFNGSEIRVPKVNFLGLFIEFKKEDVRLKNGEISRSEHHNEQAAILTRLSHLGYKSEFACGVTEAIKIIDEYLS